MYPKHVLTFIYLCSYAIKSLTVLTGNWTSQISNAIIRGKIMNVNIWLHHRNSWAKLFQGLGRKKTHATRLIKIIIILKIMNAVISQWPNPGSKQSITVYPQMCHCPRECPKDLFSTLFSSWCTFYHSEEF